MLPKKSDSQTNQTEFRDIGGAEGLLTAYQQGERDFPQVNLENADLKKANLVGINLKGANLKGANLEKVDLQSADLSEADLSNANLREAKLDAANLTEAILVQANLICAYMPRVKLIEANLREAQLGSAELTAANLQKCVLDKANCSRVRLRKAQLQEASLTQAYLRKGKLQLANLTDANLQKADLSDTELKGAILTRTDLRGAEIAQAKEADLDLAILGEIDTGIKHSLHLELKTTGSSFSAYFGSSFAFSPSGEMLANCYGEKIILVNSNTGKKINEIDIQSEPVVSVAFNADGNKIYESFYVNELKLWNPLTGELIQSLKNHSANFTSVVLDSNGKSIGMIGTGEPLQVFDVGHETRTFKGYSTEISTQAHSPDGKITARSAPDLDGQIELLERKTGKRICLLSGHYAPVQSLSFSPDSQTLVSKSAKDFRIWKVSTNKETYSCLQSARGFFPTVTFTQADDNLNPILISSDFWGEFGCRRATSGKNDAQTWNSGSSRSSYAARIALSADRKVLARCFDEQPVQLWNLQTGEELGVINLDDGYYLLTLNSTGDVLASGNKYKITLWDVKSNTILSTITHNLGWINQLVFSPNDKMLAIASDDYKIKLWNLKTNTEIKTLQGFSSIECLTFSSQEPILASGSSDGSIGLWDLETFEIIHSFIGHQKKITYLQFSPNGKFLASSDERLMRLWKLTYPSS